MRGLHRCFYLLCLIAHIGGLVYIENQLKNVVVNEGSRARFACKTSIHPRDQHKLQLTWKHDGSILRNTSGKYTFKVDKNRHILTIHDVDLIDAGVYSCRATVGADVDISSAHLTVTGVPDPPQEVQIISCHGHSAEIVWQPSGNNGAKITEFFVQFNTTDDPDTWHQYYESFRGKVQSAFIDLAPWGTYAFRVVAKNSVGDSRPSHVTDRSCTPPPDRPDGNPKDVQTRTDKKGILFIEWTPMHRLYHHGPGFRYHVYWRPRGSTYWNSAIVDDPSAASFEVEVDDVYGIYEILVKAENDLGESHQPAFVYLGHSGEGEPVVSPKDFRLDPTKPVQPEVAHFIWESVDEEVDNIRGRFIGYKLRYWKSSEGRLKKNEVDIIMQDQHGDWAPDVRVALPNLPAYTALRAQVAVMNTHYTGPPSQTIDFFTPEGAPGPVRELHVEATGMKYVLLKWLPPDEPNGVLTGYNIGYQEAINGTFGKFIPLSPRINNPSTLGARITGLDTAHQYRFHVTSRTKSSLGVAQYIDIKTASGRPPVPPSPLIANINHASANLSWTSSGMSSSDHYFIEYRMLGDISWKKTGMVRNKSWQVLNHLSPNCKYEVRVIARNGLGDLASSRPMLLTTSLQEHRNYYRLANDQLQEIYEPFSGAQQVQLSLVVWMLMNITWLVLR